jgi:hypothetical protein
MFSDVPTSVRIADLRRKVESIQELNNLFHSKRYHAYQEQTAHENRKIRLEQIKQELASLRPSH